MASPVPLKRDVALLHTVPMRKFTVKLEVSAPLMRDVHAALDAAQAKLAQVKGYLITAPIKEVKK